jgi:hypothetical protein
MPGTTLCEWFKLFLEPQALRDESAIDPRLPALPVSLMLIVIGPFHLIVIIYSLGKKWLILLLISSAVFGSMQRNKSRGILEPLPI